MTPAVPRLPFCISGLRGRIPLSPYPENPGPERSLEDELRGHIDPATAAELGELMWKQQNRVWHEKGSYTDPWFAKPFPEWSPSTHRGVTSSPSRPETTALYGPPQRINECVHLGESLANLGVPAIDNDGFEGVLDLYRGAVQGSTLSGELELMAGGDAGLTSVGWDGVGCLEISIKGGPSAPSPSGGPQESRITTLEEYKRVIETENMLPLSASVPPKEELPLGIEWSSACCGYITGRVVNVRSATATTNANAHTSKRKRC